MLTTNKFSSQVYRERLLNHYHRPHNQGLRERADYQASGTSEFCGDALTIQLDTEKEKVAAVRFEGQGCVISMSAASLLSDYVVGMEVTAVARLGVQEVVQQLGVELPPARLACGLLALKTIQVALCSK